MAKEKTYDVFISYRRQGGAVKAELTKDELAKRGFRESRMFMDTRSLSSGNYMESILKAVDASRNLVVIITKDSFKDLSDDSPWAKEIAHALETGKTIVPVYFDGITELKPAQLPESIQRLAFENAVIYVHQYADASFDRLAERLSKEPAKVSRSKCFYPKKTHWFGALMVLIAAYLISLIGLFYYAKSAIIKKDVRLAKEAYDALERAFNGRDRIVCVEFSGQDVHGDRVGTPTKNNTIRKKEIPRLYQKDDGTIEVQNILERPRLSPKEEYEWDEAYNDILQMYELSPRYDGDEKYFGFMFRIYERGANSISVYTLYPRFVGIKNNYYTTSLRSIIDDCFSYYTSNDNSPYQNDIRYADHNHFNEFELTGLIENSYYEMWSYRINSDLVGGIEQGASIGRGSRFHKEHHSSTFYTPSKSSDLNKLGFFTWWDNGYNARVYLEAYPIDVLSLRYRFIDYRGDPMDYDIKRLLNRGGVMSSIVFLLLLTTLIILWKRNREDITENNTSVS